MVCRGSSPSYQLFGTDGSISGTENVHQGSESVHSPVQVQQCNSSVIPESQGQTTLRPSLQTSSGDLGVVSKSGDYTNSRTSPGPGQHNSGLGIQDKPRPERLEAQFISVSGAPATDGTTRSGSVCITSHSTTPTFLQLAPRSGGRGHRFLHTEMGSTQGICQPTLVPHQQVPGTNNPTGSKSGANNSTVDNSTLVPSSPGNARGLPMLTSQHSRFSDPASGETVHNGSGNPTIDRMAHLRSTFSSQGLSTKASELLLSSWRSKTNKSYNSLCSKWISWCQSRDRNPFEGPVSDVVNFLAELHSQGYQYRSLNSYRSAISSIHSKIEGHPVGEHPLVSRVLKGAYNARPPLPRYNTFWDVGVVLQYIKGLGQNSSLTLHQISIKTAMLLALTRPSRSADLANLDISARTYVASGVIFKPLHLSKRSRASRPMEDFFFPEFTQDPGLCPVQALKAYESRTVAFRNLDENTTQSKLFLSWIGKHAPVTSSTIARWLCTCLFEAGIDTSVFKAHSVRGVHVQQQHGLG